MALAFRSSGLVIRSSENPDIARAAVSSWRMVAATAPPHPNVARALAVSDDGGALLMPRYAADLFTALWEPDDMPPLLATVFNPMAVATGLVEAVLHMHRHGLAHRDIKPENVLLTRTGEAVLADLDFCTRAQQLPIRMFAGTARYTPPSVYRRYLVYKSARNGGAAKTSTAGRSSYDPFANDRFALAVTVLDLLVRDAAWLDATPDGLQPEDLIPPLQAVGAAYGSQVQLALKDMLARLSAGCVERLRHALCHVEV